MLKGADRLRGYRAADHHFVFAFARSRFSQDMAQGSALVTGLVVRTSDSGSGDMAQHDLVCWAVKLQCKETKLFSRL